MKIAVFGTGEVGSAVADKLRHSDMTSCSALVILATRRAVSPCWITTPPRHMRKSP